MPKAAAVVVQLEGPAAAVCPGLHECHVPSPGVQVAGLQSGIGLKLCQGLVLHLAIC